MLTLIALQINFIWMQKLSVTGILYILCRYTAFIDVPLRLLGTPIWASGLYQTETCWTGYVSHISPDECLLEQKISTAAHALGSAVVGRTYLVNSLDHMLNGR